MADILQQFHLEQSGERFPKMITCQHDREPLAKMWLIWGRTYKIACKRHPQCILMINKTWFPMPLHSALGWVARGRSDSAAQHAAEAERLRSIGKVRKPTSG